VLFSLAAVVGAAPAAGQEKPPAPDAALADFQKTWKPVKTSTRPLDDAGWKARLAAFQHLVRAGNQALPVLTEALAKGDDDTRVFAAQALGFLADPASRPALEAALKDPHAPVRLYAIMALSMFGKLDPTEAHLRIRDQEANSDVKANMRFALGRDDQPDAASLHQTMLAYDLSRVNTAAVGKPAPDFTLTDTLGKRHTLSQLRGQKAVVLIFIYGDT